VLCSVGLIVACPDRTGNEFACGLEWIEVDQ